jgi:uncharacterized protein YndB with AHSA1/START domain
VRCPIDHAFRIFTSEVDLWWPPGHRRFKDSRLCLEAAEGGRFFERSPDGKEATLGEIVRCEPPHRISYTWYPGALREPTLVEVDFAEEGEETIVRVVHSEAESALGAAWPSRVALFTRGWELVLAAFAAFATGVTNDEPTV